MNVATSQFRSSEISAFGGMMDAMGGVATAVLAIVALTGTNPQLLEGVATIVFGGTLLVQGGTLVSEYSQLTASTSQLSAVQTTAEALSGDGLAALFPVGLAGIVLGILALLGVSMMVLAPVALIAFGVALMLSSQSVRRLYSLQAAARQAAEPHLMREYLSSELASGSAGLQFISGVAAAVLGIIAVSEVNYAALTLVGLLIVGLTLIVSGGALSGLVLSFARGGAQAS